MFSPPKKKVNIWHDGGVSLDYYANYIEILKYVKATICKL